MEYTFGDGWGQAVASQNLNSSIEKFEGLEALSRRIYVQYQDYYSDDGAQ